MKGLILQLRDDVSAGKSLTASLKTHPAQFHALFCNLVDAGEQSGALEMMLDRLASYQEKTEALKAKIKKALNYPTFVLVVVGVALTVLLVKEAPPVEWWLMMIALAAVFFA